METCQYHVIYHHDHRWPKPAAIPVGTGSGGFTFGDSGGFTTDGWPIGGDWDEYSIGGEEEAGGKVTGTLEWTEISEKVEMYGFDQIMAISQEGIIADFLALWNTARTSKDASLVKWSYEEYFEATFKPMTLRLLSNGRAIVWVHLQEGFLKTLRNWLPWSEYVFHLSQSFLLLLLTSNYQGIQVFIRRLEVSSAV